MSTIKEGEMFKRGKVNTDWKLRTFILDKKMLSYFKGSRATPAGVINLSEIKEVTPFEDIGEFHVVTDKRTYDFKGSKFLPASSNALCRNMFL
jgi:hypothetical protein